MSAYLDDQDPADPDAWLRVEEEWRQRRHMALTDLRAGWRHDRLIYELKLPASGWYVDINDARSFSAIEEALGPQLFLLGGIKEIDLSVLSGMRRDITCTIAEWIHGQILDDGMPAHGIIYPARTGGGECCATWLRELDAGKDAAAEPTTVAGATPILANDDALINVQQTYGIRIR